RGALRIHGRHDDPRYGSRAVRMPLPLRPPHQLWRQVLAEIDAANRYFRGIEPCRAKPSIPVRAIETYRAGEGLYRQDREPGEVSLRMRRLCIGGFEYQTVQPDRKWRQLRSVGAALGKTKELQIIGREHREVIG